MRRAGPDLALTAAFALLFLADLAHHAPWRDELLAWMIARTAATPLDLFRALHVDGHPGLWHALLWPLTRVTEDPVAMNAVQGVIGLGIIVLIGLASPFARWERVLLLANYFVVFEYTVISRNYGIGLLLALGFAWSRVAAPAALWRNAALLALLANAHVYCAILAAVLGLEYLAERLRAGVRPEVLLPPALLAAAGFVLMVATVWPAPDLSREVTQPLEGALSPGHFIKTAIRFAIPLAPVTLSGEPWDFLLFPRERTALADLPPYIAGAALLYAVVIAVLWRDVTARVVFLATIALAVLCGHLLHAVAVRHWGISFIALFACLWMARMRGGAPAGALLGVLLLLGAVGGGQALVLQWQRPFSTATATARWIAASPYAARPLIGVPDAPGAAVAALLARDFTMLECGCIARRAVFTTARDGFRRDMMPAVLAEKAPPEALLVSAWALTEGEIAAMAALGLRVRPLVAFGGGWVDEDFAVYAVDR